MQDKILKLRDLLESTGLQEESGSIIYSGDSTLKRGTFYFLGTNPGGNNLNYPDTILNQVILSKEKNEYFDGNWGNSTHQETIKRMLGWAAETGELRKIHPADSINVVNNKTREYLHQVMIILKLFQMNIINLYIGSLVEYGHLRRES